MDPADDLSPSEALREAALTGVAVVVPLFITLYVLVFLLDFVAQLLEPLLALTSIESVWVLGGVTAAVVAGLILLIGFLAHSPVGERAIDSFDRTISHVPGFGTVYRSFRRMGDAMIESDADNFRDVKLMEFPSEGSYIVVFVTADTPEGIEAATGNGEMTTVFLPMAPNPVMGGFVVNVADENLVDADLTLEEAFRAIVTSGVGIDEMRAKESGLSSEELERLTGKKPVVQREGE